MRNRARHRQKSETATKRGREGCCRNAIIMCGNLPVSSLLHPMASFRIFLIGAVTLLTAVAVRAAEESSGKQLGGAGVRIEERVGSASSPSDIARLVRQIGSADYSAREAATRELVAAGPQAIPLLAEAAAGDDLETAYRAVRVLQSFSDGEDRATQKRAVAVLEKLAATGNKTTAAL